MVQVMAPARGRRPTVLLAPELTDEQRKAVRTFDLGRWLPTLISSMSKSAPNSSLGQVA
jgi:hypothetical protein